MALFVGTITLSGNLDYFENQGAYYVYHNLFGYILEMSRDIIDFLEYFRGEQRTPEEVAEQFGEVFEPEALEQFIEVFMNQGCLVPQFATEESVALEMVPVRARWTTFHVPPEGAVTLYVPHRDADRVDVIELDAWDSAFWRAADGETSLADLAAALASHPDAPAVGLEDKVVATLSRFTHSSMQLLKLCPQALSAFGKGHNARPLPPYIKSTMPYRKVTEEVRGDRDVHVGFDVTEEVEVVGEAEGFEATLAYLFRDPDPALSGRSYGGALAHQIGEKGHLTPGTRVLEAGALTGDLARGFLDEVRDGWPEVYADLSMTVLCPDEALAPAILVALESAGHTATVVAGEVVTLGGLEGGFDVIISDEYMATFETTLLRKVALDAEDEDEARPAPRETLTADGAADGGGEEGPEAPEPTPDEAAKPESDEPKPKKKNGRSRNRDIYLGQGDSVSVVFKHNLTFHDVDGEFMFNIGAVRFVEAVGAALNPGGIAVLIEYGDLFEYPEPSGADGEQYAIRFQTLQDVAKALKLRSEFNWIVHYLEFDTGRQMLTTTQHQFKALRVLLERHGVTLENRATSKNEWLAMLELAQLAAESLPEIEFKSLNDRVMGLVPAGVKLIEIMRDRPGEDD